MKHPRRGTLQALSDGELAPGERETVERHLSACTECRSRLRALTADFARFSDALPASGPVSTEIEYRRLRRRSRARWLPAVRWAALFLLTTSTALAATVPGSPLREWIRGIGPEAPAGAVAAEGIQTTMATAAVDPLSSTGVSIRPSEAGARIVLERPAEGLRIHLRLAADPRVRLSTRGEASSARLHTAPDEIQVRNAGAGEIRIDIPQAIPRFALEADGELLFEKRGEEIRLRGMAEDSPEPGFLFVIRP